MFIGSPYRPIAKKIITYFFLTTFAFFPLQLFKGKEKKGWFPFYIPWTYCKGSRVDMSFLLDAPAGKHGFLTVRDGHFSFEDGKRVRFWGLNIHSNRACFPTHLQAEDIAKRLAQLGCNIVRMHFLDNPSPYGIIDADYNDSQHISAPQMERLDYFIYQLKENGVYVTFDVMGLGARQFKPADRVTECDRIRFGAGGVSFFDKRIIELSKKYAMDFLSHVNPYTGKSYLNEPAVAMVEMTNENTLFADWLISGFPPYYRKEINFLWKRWLKDKGYDLKRYRHWSDDREFLFELQSDYEKKIYSYLRSIGVKVPIGASNMPFDNLNLAIDANMDFTDIHVYWDLSDRLDRIHNRSLIRQDPGNYRTMVNTMAIAKVKQKPLISTEWGTLWPNDWRAVDILTMVSYASLNDWDGLFLYSYNGGWDMSWDDLENKLYYGTVIFNDPAKMGVFPIASLIFLRNDVKCSSNVYTVSYNIDKLFDITDSKADRSRLAGISYISRLQKEFYRGEERNSAPIYPALTSLSAQREKTKIISDTGEILRDHGNGIFMLNTPRTLSFSGFVGKEKEYDFKDIKFCTDAHFSTLTLMSLDKKDISDSAHLLLTVVGRARNKGQRFTPNMMKKMDDMERDIYILKTGTRPILVEGANAEISIKRRKKDKSLKVFSLDERGLRKAAILTYRDADYYRFKASDGDRAIYYEIIRE